MKPIVKWTLWQRRWSIFWWSVGIFFLIFINMIFYPSFKDQAAELQKSFENLPDATVQFIGGSTDFFSPVGFLNSQIFFLMLPLFLGVLAIGLGSSILAREEQDKTVEILLARPVSRSKFLAAKAIAALIIIAFASLIGLITTVVSAKLVDLDVSTGRIILATLACFLLALSFASIAFVFTAIGRARAASIGIATAFGLGGYIISSLSETVRWLSTPSKIFPFHYYDPEAILRGVFSLGNSLFLLSVIVLCGLVSWLSFRRRDIY